MAVPGSFNLDLSRFSQGIHRRFLESGEDFADEVVAEAKRIAPVDTGTYRSDIQKRRAFSLAGAFAALFGRGSGIWKWYCLSTVPYAEWLEFGHSRQAPRGVFGIAAATVRARRRGSI